MSKTPLRGKLTVNVKGARALQVVQLIGTQDPFVEIKVGDEKYKTKVHDNGGEKPVWNQAFIFNLDGKADVVHFLVKNKNLVSDQDIGRADIPVEKLATADGSVEYQLVDVNAFKKTAGFIIVESSFSGTGLPAKPAAAAAPAQPAQAAKPAQPAQPQPQPQVVYQQAPPQQVVYVQRPAQPQVVYAQQPQVVYAQQPQVVYQQQPQVIYQQAPPNYMQPQNPTY